MAPTTWVWLNLLTWVLLVCIGGVTSEQIAVRDRLCVLEGGTVEKRWIVVRYVAWNNCNK